MDTLKNCLLATVLAVFLLNKGESIEGASIGNFSQVFPSHFTPEDWKKLAELVKTTKDGDKADVNELTDKILTKINGAAAAAGLAEVQLADQSFSFKFPWLGSGLNQKAYVRLTDGSMQGLTTLQRDGDAILSSGSATTALTLPLKLSTLFYSYKYQGKLLSDKIAGVVNGRIEDPNKIAIVITFDKTTSAAQIKLLQVISNKSTASIKSTGNAQKDKMQTILANAAVSFLQSPHHKFVSNWAKELFNAIVASYNEQL